MKKFLMILSAAVLLFTGCAKENSEFGGEGDLVNVTFSASVKSTTTRAAVDNDGLGENANRCIMELWYANKVYGRYVAPVTGYQATFNVTIPAKRTYQVVLWADCATDNGDGTFTDLYYNTSENLANITLNSDYVGNDDARDAFFYSDEQEVTVQGGSFSATLTRPFAQINVITTDVQDIKMVELYPEKVNLAFKAATSFNAVEGTCGELEDIEYEASVYKAYDESESELTLSMDYLFASDERSAVDIAFVAPTEGTFEVEHEFSNIPYQRNYRTNIKGALLTTTGQWTVTINYLWNTPDENISVYEAGSIAAANEAFANGATNVKITSVGEETTLYLPQITEDVTIDFANPSEAITVKYGPAPTKAGSVKPVAVNIATNDISKFVVTGIDNVIWLVGNQAALANALTKATNKQIVALSNDITLTDEWTPVISEKDGNYYYGTFDGRNHTISNLKITDYTGKYAGFFSTMSGATIKNVTFKNATVTNAVSNEGARGAVIVGWSYAGVINNCHVINASVTGGQKVAGILGTISVEGASSLNEVTNCSVDGLTLSCNVPNDILYQAGGLVGYIQLINANPNGVLIENNSVKNITINDAFGGSDNTAWYCGTFMGSIIRKQQVAGQKIVLNNNTISGNNNALYKSIYSSEYFGWTTNTENYTGAIAPIIIDGQEWKPVFYMDAEGKYHITNLDALKYFRDMVNADKSFENKMVLLDADIDMTGETWTPIGNVNGYPGTSFAGIFDGQNNTIKNLTCTDNTPNNACAALFGSLMGTVKNVTLKNVNISSTHYAGGIVAYSSSSESKVESCKVIGGTITSTPEWMGSEYDNGDKVGGIFGYNGEGGTVNNCYVEGVTLKAYRDLGAIVGAGGVNKTTNNKAKDCVLQIDRKNFYGDKDVNANPIVGRNLGGTLNANNTFDNVTISILANSASALKAAVQAANAPSAGIYTITIANGTYEVSDIAIAENANNKTVTIKAATKGGVTLKMNSDSKSKQIFLVDGYSGNYKTYSLYIDGIKFDLTAVTSGDAAPVYAFQAGDSKAATIGYTTAGPNLRYAHHITIQNCELKGAAENAMMFFSLSNTSPNNVVVKDCSIANVGYLFSGYCDTFTATGVTATNVKHFINNQGEGIIMDDCTVDCYTDYAVRANAGPISITNSAFTMTYTGSDNGGVYVDRGANTQITMSGNTYPASYAGANMHDVYNEQGGDCTINGTITLTNGESYDFPRE